MRKRGPQEAGLASSIFEADTGIRKWYIILYRKYKSLSILKLVFEHNKKYSPKRSSPYFTEHGYTDPIPTRIKICSADWG